MYYQAAINEDHLNKKIRRAPKGAAAQAAAQKRRVEEEQAAAQKRKVEEEQARAREATKKIKLEMISNDQFFKRLQENNNANNFSNELKHYILGLNNNNFKV